ncbi:hypothetical protein [Saccharopolyspora sp. 5N708]
MLGGLRLAYESLPLPDTDEQRLVVYLPADASTADTLAALNSDPVETTS